MSCEVKTKKHCSLNKADNMVKGIKNLAHASKEEQKRFIGSFDRVFCDLDGVIWLAYKPLPGTKECIKNFKSIGKEVAFVTNNATLSTDQLCKILIKNDFFVEVKDIINPATGYISLLNEINFDKTIYMLGSEALKEDLKKANFKISENPPPYIEEEIPVLAKNIADDENIGAVIIDYDINLTMVKLQKALTYLKRRECLFVIGAGEKMIPFSFNGPLMGNYYIYEGLKEISGRQPQQMAKPSQEFSDLIKRKFSITNPDRVLVIGDSAKEDMMFASTSGYQKLLVLTGVTKRDDIENWKFDQVAKPEYYVDSMEALNLILGMLK